MNIKKSETEQSAPFKGNKGKGGLKWIEEQLLEEQKKHKQTLLEMDQLIADFDAIKIYMKNPDSARICRTKKTIWRNKIKTGFHMGIERIYLRWIYYRSPSDKTGAVITASAITYPWWSKILAQFPDSKRNTLYQFEQNRLSLIHRMRVHIDTFSWLTNLKELKMHNRSKTTAR